LGNRSIIARADSKKISSYVSQKLKQREWYRPVAPVMLEKHLPYFAGSPSPGSLSQFMLTEFHIQPGRINELEGAVHVDGTSRIQTLNNRSENPYLYDLLVVLEARYGLKALLNTSFNSKGKPLVHTEKDALEEAQNMGIKHLVLNGKLRKL
jgi:carbamoyltransferase